jgi:hypothetical protein
MLSTRKSATASVYFEWAVDPHSAASAHIFLFGAAPEPVTEATVRKEFGDKAADAWIAAKNAKAAFWAAVKGGDA